MLLKLARTYLKRGSIYLTQKELEIIKYIKHSEFKIKFRNQKIKYKQPIYTTEECISKRKTYGVSIYVPVQIKYKEKLIIE